MARRRAASLLAPLAAAAAIAGCGGGGSGAASPLDEALGYLPADAPLAIVVDTDTGGGQFKGAGRIVDRFPFGGQVIDSLKRDLEGGRVSFEDDVRPLLGNELVIGVAKPRDLLATDVKGFVGALETKDGGKLAALVSKQAAKIGDEGGAKLYRSRDGGDVFAVKGDVLVLSDSEGSLRAAVKQREADDRLRADAVSAALEGLPGEAAAKLYVNIEALLAADPSTAPARKVPFVSALRTLGATASIETGRIAVDFKLATAGSLDERALPIAAGTEAPPVVGRPGEIGAGVRDPAQIVKFAESVGQAVSPEGFAQYAQAKQQIARALRLDLDRDVIGQFSGDVSVAIDLDGRFAVRAKLQDPRRFERTLRQLVRVIPSFARGAGLGDVGISRPRAGEDFYGVARPGGGGIVYGVVGGVFVLSNDPKRAADLASEQPQQVQGAQGAVVFRADAEQLANQFLSRLGGLGALGAGFTAPLGELVGSLQAGGDGLTGRISLSLDG